MKLTKNQIVIFKDIDGTKIKRNYLDINYSQKNNSFYTFSEIDGSKLFSNEIIKVETKKRNYKKQVDTSKMQQIFPINETEKSYIIEDETTYTNKTKNNVFTKCIAKSICTIENGKIYAPYFATR